MSIPYTGQLQAEIRGLKCSFTGKAWTTPDPDLTVLLDTASKRERTAHMSIYDLAVATLKSEELPVNILSWESDSWDEGETLPPEAVE